VVYNSDDSEEDGFRGARVRGDAHDENKAAERELRKKKKAKKDKSKKTKSKKNIMYEAEDYETGVAAAVKIGLGGGSDKSASKKRREVAEMSLADRTMIDKEKRSVISETRRVRVKGKGASSEISFIPKDVLKKRAAEEAKKKVVRGSDDQRKRTRRGIKDLGFKTPFKNTK
jgi:hypothetical protein